MRKPKSVIERLLVWLVRPWLGVFALVLGLACLYMGYQCNDEYVSGLWQDSGFLLIGVVFTVFIVDVLVKRHEDEDWEEPKEIVWDRMRAISTLLITSLTVNIPDADGNVLNPSFVPLREHRLYETRPGMLQYTNPRWIEFIEKTAVPAFETNYPYATSADFQELTETLRYGRGIYQDTLYTIRPLMSPVQMACTLTIIDQCNRAITAAERWSNALAISDMIPNWPPPDLKPIIETAMRIIEEVNRAYEIIHPDSVSEP